MLCRMHRFVSAWVQQLSTALYSKIAGIWFCFPIGYVPAAQLGYIHVPGVTRSRFPQLAELDRPSHRFTQKIRARDEREY
jgi:hypothetical protein